MINEDENAVVDCILFIYNPPKKIIYKKYAKAIFSPIIYSFKLAAKSSTASLKLPSAT